VLKYITLEILKLGDEFSIVVDGEINPNMLPIDDDLLDCVR
jgi:hypothetical protein